MQNKTLLQLTNISKYYGNNCILDEVSLSFGLGEIVALLGLNGAGKTTLINIILEKIKPTSGQIYFNSNNASSTATKLKVGVVQQDIDFPEELTVKEIILFVSAHFQKYLGMAELVQMFALQNILKKRSVQLSGGQKRLLALALAFVGLPEILFLDEPTVGLDLQSQHLVHTLLRDFVQKSGTVLLTTHNLSEAEVLASRVLILHKGKIKTVSNLQQIRESKLCNA